MQATATASPVTNHPVVTGTRVDSLQMAQFLIRTRGASRPVVALCALLATAVALTGCRRGIVYDARALPDEFRAAQAVKSRSINMTRLAAPGMNSSSIGAGDVVEITIATGLESGPLNPVVARVADDGTISIPLVGSVAVAGLEPAEAEQSIASVSVQRGVYRNPSVTLLVKRQQANKITVVGAVESPGVYELPRASSDLLGVLAMAGGRTEAAGPELEILRKHPSQSPSGPLPNPQGPETDRLASFNSASVPAQPTSIRINLDQVSQKDAVDYRLSDGDVVMVYPEDPRVIHVIGLVHKPGQFEIPPGEDVHVLDALALAGGRTLQVADKVKVIRHVAGQTEPLVINVSVSNAKQDGDANLRLAPGDLVSVEETPTTLLVDMLKSFIRFGVSASTPIF